MTTTVVDESTFTARMKSIVGKNVKVKGHCSPVHKGLYGRLMEYDSKSQTFLLYFYGDMYDWWAWIPAKGLALLSDLGEQQLKNSDLILNMPVDNIQLET